MATSLDTHRHGSSNAFARTRDRQILWLLERHPATAGMLVNIGFFPTRKKATKRLNRLLQRNQLRRLGTISLKGGRPEHVYARGRGWKADALSHEVLITRLCLKVHAEEIRRGPGEGDPILRPDAELWIHGARYLLEMDCGTKSYPEIVRTRFSKYTACPDLVLWVAPTLTRMEGLRRHAGMIREVALFTTINAALANPHAAIWVDFDGERAALPRGDKGGKKPGDKGGDKGGCLSPPASGGATPL
jgi:hypothetical protein